MKKWLAMLLSIILTVQLAVPAWAADGGAEHETVASAVESGTCGENLTWKIEDGVLTISGTGAMTGYPPSQSPWAAAKIRSVVIESGVTSIGSHAFSDCSSLTSVEIPNSITFIDQGAFSGCSNLTSITIPDGVTTIRSGAFRNCSSLTSITIPDSVTNIGEGVFYHCTGLADDKGFVIVRNMLCGYFGKGADVVVPTGVTKIDIGAFEWCSSLASIAIPNSITSIGSSAFQGCSSLTSVEIPDSVTSIGGSAFQGCSSLTSVKIPDGIVTINSYVFSNCSSLTSITIPDSVTNICPYAFSNCSGLTSVEIPDSVTSIGPSAFYDCSALTDVYYGGSRAGWNKIWIYEYNDQLTGATIHYAKTDPTATPTQTPMPTPIATPVPSPTATPAEPSVPTSGTCGENLTWKIEDGVLTISGTGAMMDYSWCQDPAAPWAAAKIKSVVIESGVTSIGNSAFYGFSLTSITIPDSVTSIGDSAFRGCTGLTSVTIPDGVTSIGECAFTESSLTSITIPDSVTSIGRAAFSASSLTSIEIPDSVTNIGEGAFYVCPGLADDGGFVIVCNILCGYFGKGADVAVPTGVTKIDMSAFQGCSSLVSIAIPDSVTSIGQGAFSGCSNLTSITIPDGVTSIENYTFFNCSSLTSVEIPEGVTSIGCGAFWACTSLTDVYYSGCSEAKWNSITVGEQNDPFQKATVHYLEHQWNDGEITAPATCTEDGVKTFTCSVCKETKTETLEKLGHAFGAVEVIKAPTCTETGISGKRCQHEGCEVIDSETVLAATGHQWDDGKVATEPTYEKDGIKTFTCSVCKATKTETIPAPTPIASGTCGSADNESGESSVKWSLFEDGILIISGTGAMADWEYSEPAPWSDYRPKIKTVVINPGITVIGRFAFDRCTNLTNVTIPDSVTCIKFWAFHACGFTDITIPEGVERIESAFYECCELTSIVIPKSATSVAGIAFECCSSLASITVAQGNPVYHSDGNCLILTADKTLIAGCKNSAIPADGSVTRIDTSAFSGHTGLMNITIPNTVTSIGALAFMACSGLETILVAEGNPVYHSDGNCIIKTADKTLVVGCKNSVIPADGSVTSIGRDAFFACSGLTSITIPEGVTSIGGSAFWACTSLTDVYYSGCSEAKWNSITVGEQNDPLQNATVHYLEHQWDEGKVTTPATCTEDGIKTFTCSVCKETRTETVEKLGHSFGAVKVIKAPTCTETGISGKRCTHEGCDVIDSETVIPASGHKWDEGKVTTEPTCTEDGVKTYTCSVCDETKTETITATGHQWDEGVVTSEPTYTENGEKTFTCVICRTTRTETIPALTPEPDSVDLNEIAKDFDGSSIGVDVDGKTVYPDGEGNYPRLTVPEGTTTLISVSTCNLPEGVDSHTRYPVSMAVYKATNTDGTTSVERISEMDDLLRYAGSSIRITGNKGIRLITGINASLKSALTSEGVAGYTLEEYGTLLCWASEVQNGSLSLSDAYARHNYAYSLANGTDPVFRYAGDVVQYTNVLVGFSNEQCVDDIAMRPYITLRDADGNTYTLYGGIVNRSIGYIAYQNRGAFTPGTNAYNYIWDIIHFVYGDAYDEDYKG